MFFEGVGELLQHADAGDAGTGQPILQEEARQDFVPLGPDLPEVFLHVVGDGQRFVQTQGTIQTLAFLFLGVEIFRVLQEEPTNALEKLLASGGEFVKQLSAKGAELVVEQLDHMKAIEDVNGFSEILAHGPDIGGGHVGGNGLDLGVRAPQSLPEGLQGVHALAVTDENHGAGEKIEDNGQVAMALADVDFVDGDLLEVVQLGLAELALEVPGLDVLDDVPANDQMFGNILDGHEMRQFQSIALEGASVMLLGVGESELDLANLAARKAQHARHFELDERRLLADRQRPEGAFDAALGPDVLGAAMRAAQSLAWLFDAKRGDARLDNLADVAVADDAEAVLQ